MCQSIIVCFGAEILVDPTNAVEVRLGYGRASIAKSAPGKLLGKTLPSRFKLSGESGHVPVLASWTVAVNRAELNFTAQELTKCCEPQLVTRRTSMLGAAIEQNLAPIWQAMDR